MTPTSRRAWRSAAAAATCTALLSGLLVLLAVPSSGTPGEPYDGPVPGVPCDAASTPESTQGRAPESEASGSRRDTGWTCNATAVSRTGPTGGYRVERYVDLQGHECAFFDTTLLFPKDAAFQGAESSGTWVMDMTDPAKPVHTATLRTPAFQSPHESVRLNQRRGLLVADMGYPTYNPGFVDVYDVSGDCRNPQLRSSTPLGLLGHESGFAPDGFTFYVASLYGHTVSAVDLTNPALPSVLWTSTDFQPHGIGVSDDGTRLYMTESVQNLGGYRGLTILDVSQIQRRMPNPKVTQISRLAWPHIGTPQNALPFTRNGRRYLAEIDEFGSNDNVGGARIIDIQDETKPFVVSVMRLAVNQKDAQGGEQKNDPGASGTFQGYRGHNCELPTRVDPTMLACSFIVSGLRVFDISDVTAPQEIAYFNPPYRNTTDPRYTKDAAYAGNFAMSAPAFALERREIWYSDGNSGLYVVRLREAAQRSATLGTPGASPTASASGTATPSATATATVTPTPPASGSPTGTPAASPAGTAGPTPPAPAASSPAGSSPPGPAASSPAASTPPPAGPPASSPPPGQPAPSPTPGDDPDPTATGPRTPLTLAVDRGTVVRGDRFVLTVSGQQYALVDVRCYSRPDTDYVSVRRGLRLPESGRLQVPLRPGTSSRCYVRYVEEEGSATPSRRLLVRAAVTLQARPLSPGLVRFSGRSMTALAGQQITVYRIADGRTIRAAVTRTRADGTWSVDRRFTGAGRFGFFARTDDTPVNLAGYTAIVAATVR